MPNLNRDVDFLRTRAEIPYSDLDNKVFQLWIIYANTQILSRDIFLRICAEIPNYDLYNSL